MPFIQSVYCASVFNPSNGSACAEKVASGVQNALQTSHPLPVSQASKKASATLVIDVVCGVMMSLLSDSAARLPSQMHPVLLVLAEIFEDVGVGQKVVRDLYAKGLGVHLRVVEGNLILQISKVHAPEALYHAQRLAMRVAHAVERSLVVEAGGLHYKGSVRLPMTRGVSV